MVVMTSKINISVLISLVFSVYGCQGVVSRKVAPDALETRIRQVLLIALEDENPLLRVHALESLAQLATLDVIPKIRSRLYDPIPAVQFAAAVAVGDVKDYASENLLQRLLASQNVSVQLAAGYALEKLGDQRFAEWYDKVLFGSDEKLAGQACMLLGKLGNTTGRADSPEKLWKVLRASKQLPNVQLQAAEALARLGDESILDELLIFTNSLYASDKILAISGLQHIGGTDVFAVLTGLTDDPQIEVRLAAVRALGDLAEEDHIQFVRESLRYSDPDDDLVATIRVRSLALLALGNVGGQKDGSLLFDAMDSASREYIKVAAARAAIDYIKRIRKAAATEQLYK
jgi:HEAT repeat protein